MKKLLFLLGITVFTLSAFAERNPDVVVHKRNGGLSAIFNLYNDITYTPSSGENVPATLDCIGSGWSPCRVPRANTIECRLTDNMTQAQREVLANTINDLIMQSERQAQRGLFVGSASKTLSMTQAGTGTRGGKLYSVTCKWDYDNNGDGTMNVWINEANL